MDLLSGVASVIAVVEIAGKLAKICHTYWLAVKDARVEISRLRNEVTLLCDVLSQLEDFASESNSQKDGILKLLNNGPIEQCKADLLGVIQKLDPGEGKKELRRYDTRALKWPFTNKEIEVVLVRIGRHKGTFTLALTVDHMVLAKMTQNQIAIVGNRLVDVQSDQKKLVEHVGRQETNEMRKAIDRWLFPDGMPDPSTNQNSAQEMHQSTTGEWFLCGKAYEEWADTSGSFLWLHGTSGCGKTVLCSSIINDVKRKFGDKHGAAVAYFYFDFNDINKQSPRKFLCSIIRQFSSQSTQATELLVDAVGRSEDGLQQPSRDTLESLLQDILETFNDSFVLIDALDESKERDELLALLETVVGWKTRGLHLLATSRRELAIQEALNGSDPLITEQICLESSIMDADIQKHIRECLAKDLRFKKWPATIKNEVEETLLEGANGMFRWVVCQLEALRKCSKPDAVRNALKSLPRTLDSTYERILCNIEEEDSHDAFKILQWLVYSARPLQLEEAAEVVAIDLDSQTFSIEKRLWDAAEVFKICSSLVSRVIAKEKNEKSEVVEVEQLRLAHFSVKEYLVSSRVCTGPASQYNVQQRAQGRIARQCLIYLLHFDEITFSEKPCAGQDTLDDYPLARYAAQYWPEHARLATDDVEAVNELSLRLYRSDGNAYLNWLRIYTGPGFDMADLTRTLKSVSPPLYYASRDGLIHSVRSLLDGNTNANIDAPGPYNIDTGLIRAAFNGYHDVVDLLLAEGADCNVEKRETGSALQAASLKGHLLCVKKLLDKGAAVNTCSGFYNSPLQAASMCGNEEIVRLLLAKGADVNAQGSYYGTPLQAASWAGHLAIVTLLLERGAEINAQAGFVFGTALQAASSIGKTDAVKLLIEKGADVNAQGGEDGNALQAAADSGHEDIVKVLVEKGAHVNAQGGKNNNALQAAAFSGHDTIVRFLLEKGADINAEGAGERRNALQAAGACYSSAKREAVMKLLLEWGAGQHNTEAEGNPVKLKQASNMMPLDTRQQVENAAK